MKQPSYQTYLLIMLLVLMTIGVLQFFEFPKALDYVLLVLAIALGGIGVYLKLTGANDDYPN